MIEFGKTLRTARESKGLTTAQVAESTHMMIQTVEGLEREDFSKIVAPIYGRGFVKLYCETVGIDHRPLVDAFMEMYNNRHAGTPAVAPKPESIPSDPAPQPSSTAPVPQPAASEPPRVQELDFSAIRSAAPQQMHEPSPFSTSPRPPAAPAPSRYAAPMPIDDGPSFSIPTINWRLVALVAAAAALLALASLGIRAIYRATMTAPEDGQPQQTQSDIPADGNEPAKTGITARKPLPPRAFYIDSDHSTDKEHK